jgi:hypothetical protein
MDLDNSTQMVGTPEEKAATAIRHTLGRIRHDESIGWYLGYLIAAGKQARDKARQAEAESGNASIFMFWDGEARHLARVAAATQAAIDKAAGKSARKPRQTTANKRKPRQTS